MENVRLAEGALDTIMTVSEGDMRKAVTYLQSANELAGRDSIVTSDIVLDVSGQVFFLIYLLIFLLFYLYFFIYIFRFQHNFLMLYG